MAVGIHGAVQKPDELAATLRMLARSRPAVVVEIGSDQGGTLWAWSQLPGSPAVFGVDLPDGNWRSSPAPPQPHGAVVISGDSHDPDVAAQLEQALNGRQADVLFIDGDHSYPGVSADFRDYLRFVRTGGLVLLHDILIDSIAPFWAELRQRYQTQEITTPGEPRYGVGVVELVQQYSNPVR